MPSRGVSGKMQKALHKLQKSISSSNLNYHAMHHHSDAKSPSRTGGTLRNGCAFGRSGRFAVSDLNDSDSDSDDSAPVDVPEGNLVVYVGEERCRFVVQAKHLSHPVFKALLNKSAEEFGYEHKGGLEIACEVDFFKHMLYLIETNDSSFSSIEIDELVGIYAYPQCVDA
jgi:SAUR family protein